MSNAEIQKLIRHERVDWMDNFDNTPPPGRSLLNDIENPRYGPTTPPISCCIFTKHRNGQISRCLREPIHGNLCYILKPGLILAPLCRLP